MTEGVLVKTIVTLACSFLCNELFFRCSDAGCRCGTKNSKYKVKDHNGAQIFRIVEDTSCPMRYFCGWQRAFEIRVIDNRATEVMQFTRPIRCGQCFESFGNYCFPCCLSEMEVCAPPFDVIGKIRQNFSFLTPSFSGLDARGHEKFRVTGGFCRPWFSDLKFKIMDHEEGKQIGNITKNWVGCLTECFSNAHRFDVTFPPDAEVKDKALVLASAILLDYQHFT